MQIINTTKNTVLADYVIFAQTTLSRLKGLLFRPYFRKGEALIIKPCNSVHTFFMRFSIDLLFVDSENKVVKTYRGIKPFKVTPICFKSKFAIELPSGIVAATNTAEFDILSIKP